MMDLRALHIHCVFHLCGSQQSRRGGWCHGYHHRSSSSLPPPPRVCAVAAAAAGGGGGRRGEDADQQGDPAVQQKLVEIIRLESDKVRVSDFIEERSKHLADIAEQAISEYDRIAADTKRGLDEASAQAMESVEENCRAVEAQLACARAEMEAREEEFDAFEKRIASARNEGLFFKRLYEPLKPQKGRGLEEQAAMEEEVNTLTQTTKRSLGSRSRQIAYVLLISVLSCIFLEGLASPQASRPRVVISGFLLVILSMQLLFEKSLASKKEDTL